MIKTISFRENHFGVARIRIGINIDNKLAVVPDYKRNNDVWFIYNLFSQAEFFKNGLEGKEFAINLAEFFVQIYGDYLLIPKAWQGADVIMLARYSVEYGMKINAVHELNTVLTQEQFTQLFHTLV